MDQDAQEEALKISKVRREEEWQKVRNPDVITEKDKEEDFETKTLYERLSENRELKRLEIEEQFRYKNMVYSGLDNDEHKFLQGWENSKKKQLSERNKMEIEELQKFKARIVDLDAQLDITTQLVTPVLPKSTAVSRQKQLLSGAVKRRKVEPKKEPEPKAASAGLAGLAAYSDSDSDSDSNKNDAEKKKGSGSSSSSSSSGSSSSDSDSSSSSSGSESRRRRKKKKPSWESGPQDKKNEKNDSD